MAKEAPTRRRWFSYSLRSLFVLITAVSVPVGWVAYERRQSRHEMQIAEQLKASGASVAFGGVFDPDDTSDEPAGWHRALSGLFGPRVRELNISDSRQFIDLSLLAGLSLEGLDLHDPQVADLSPLAGLTSLKTVGVSYTQVDDLSPLAGLKELELLFLDNTPVTDLSPLAGLTNLAWIASQRTQVGDLTPLAGLKNLRKLWLDDTQVSDLTPISGLKNLRELYVRGTPVSKEQVKLLQKALPYCKIISDFAVPVAPAQSK
jgi:hypothetical protein